MNKTIKSLVAATLLTLGTSCANTAMAQEDKASPNEEWWPFISEYFSHYYIGPTTKYMVFTVCGKILIMLGEDAEGNLAFVPAHPMHKQLYDALVKYENDNERVIASELSPLLGLECPEFI